MAISYAQKASILMGHINGNLKKSRKRIETYFLSSPLAVKQDITVTIIFSVYLHACLSSSVRAGIRIFQAITSTFMHGFQNNLEQLLSLRRRSAI